MGRNDKNYVLLTYFMIFCWLSSSFQSWCCGRSLHYLRRRRHSWYVGNVVQCWKFFAFVWCFHFVHVLCAAIMLLQLCAR